MGENPRSPEEQPAPRTPPEGCQVPQVPGCFAPRHPGTLAPWHPGTLAPWHPGTLSCHQLPHLLAHRLAGSQALLAYRFQAACERLTDWREVKHGSQAARQSGQLASKQDARQVAKDALSELKEFILRPCGWHAYTCDSLQHIQ